jgi:acetylornithine deacetylase/succinyl-diaminopimelate desuccinylase-like protein
MLSSDRELSFDPEDARYLRELAEYVAVPSISRDASADTMRAAAHWLAGQLEFARGRVLETEGHPAVLGEWLAADGAPTILVYGHYDVQPTGSQSEWLTPPFELSVDGDIVRGRGATDDKGPVYIVLKTAQAFLAQEGRLPLNVKFLFEGEEEIGSPHLASFVSSHAEDLAADLVISADGAMWRPSEPSLALMSKGRVPRTRSA